MKILITVRDKKTLKQSRILRDLDTISHLYIIDNCKDLDYINAKPLINNTSAEKVKT